MEEEKKVPNISFEAVKTSRSAQRLGWIKVYGCHGKVK